jgi:nitroimidazol reductase NimA-like FMN-containing flavoprotein (pyridoxamine 5'-phosphate oxidase superfamily)
MPDDTTGNVHGSPADTELDHEAAVVSPEPEPLDEAECLRLISPGGVGRLAFSGRFGPTVFPVNYMVHEGSIVFRTAQDSRTDHDLRTGIEGAEFKVAFEIDDIQPGTREGWSVLLRGPAHYVESDTERASVLGACVEPWAGGARELFLRIVPMEITGRRIRRAAG